MVQIVIKQGLDIPIVGAASGAVSAMANPKKIGYVFDRFEGVKFRVLVKPGDQVAIGQALAEDKDIPGRFFTSLAGGVVEEVQRGDKRALTAIVVRKADNEEAITFPVEDIKALSSEAIIKKMMDSGLFALVRSRPFDRLADPNKRPRSIFVKAVETAPFVPPAEYQVIGSEREFQLGLDILSRLCGGKVHLVYQKNCNFDAFTKAIGVEKHTVQGPHPASNASIHIHAIDPIRKAQDVVWTVNAADVVAIGTLFLQGKIVHEQIISLAGPGVLNHERRYFRVRKGHSINDIVANRLQKADQRVLSGDPLTGKKVDIKEGYLGLGSTVVSVIPEPTTREPFHFFGLGIDKFTASGAYVSGHMNWLKRRWNFTTSQHGEERAFMDSSVYQRVMPMRILPMHLVRAIMGDDYELAEELGLLEVHPEDFALPEFVCPSKIEMVDIIRRGLAQLCKDTFG